MASEFANFAPKRHGWLWTKARLIMMNTNSSAPEKLYTLREALPLLGVKQTFAFQLLKEGRIRAFKIGSRLVIPESSIVAFQASLEDARPDREV